LRAQILDLSATVDNRPAAEIEAEEDEQEKEGEAEDEAEE
jgi:hypothetical protein